jgi:glycerophosphoryl diester phosphodiesterase
MVYNSEWESTAPLVIAHRGASAYAPENTMAAFERAVDLGADAIELDAKLTRDGVVAILHDDTLDRTTNGVGRLRSFTIEEIQEFDAGVKFSPKFAGEGIPSLREVFQKFSDEILLNIELTNYSSKRDDLPERVIQLVVELGLVERVLLSSFNPIALIKCRRINREIPTALVIHGREPRLLRNIFQAFLNYDFFHPHEATVGSEIIGKKLKIHAWTVNDELRIKELLTLGITGIITDVPDVAIQVRDNFLADMITISP